jgi:transposase
MSKQEPRRPETSVAAAPEFAALVAIDWADQKHVWALQVAGSDKCEQGEIMHGPETVDAWVQSLLERFAGRPIAVCLEQSRGALITLLMKYPNLVLYPLHPAAVKQMRKALYPSGAKDDPLDAEIALQLLVHHRQQLRAWKPDTPATRSLQILVEHRRQLVDQRTAESNRLRQLLKLYYPQAAHWFEDLTTPMVGDFLTRWPTLESAQKARPQRVRDFFHRHNCRSREWIDLRIEEIGRGMSATRDEAIVGTSVLHVRHLVRCLAELRDSIAELEKEIRRVSRQHPDFALFDSLPGAGEALVPRLIAAFGTMRERFASAYDVQCFSGIAPVTERSGKTKLVHFRWACSKFLRQSFHEWASHSIGFSQWARVYYQQQREKGNDHHAAVRSLAAKWIRIVYRCWKDRVPYDERIYLESLRRRGSPLADKLFAAQA